MFCKAPVPNIVWTNDYLLLVGPVGKQLTKLWNNIAVMNENEVENVVCKRVIILCRLQSVGIRIGRYEILDYESKLL